MSEITFPPTEEVKAETPVLLQETAVATSNDSVSVFADAGSFAHAQRVAKMLSSSSLVPDQYKGNIQNTLIALEMSNRIGASPLMVMQNLYIVHGKPSWSSSFIIAALNSCKRFSPLRFEMAGEGKEYGCFAWAYDLATNDQLKGPKVTMQMAETEGWLNKTGSKWKTMPELMLRYRAAAFFGRLYAPDVLMGMQTMEEVQDVVVKEPSEELKQAIDLLKTATTQEEFDAIRNQYHALANDKEFQRNYQYYHRKNVK